MALSCMLAVIAAAPHASTRAHDAPITLQTGKEHWVAGSGFLKGIGVATLLGDFNQTGTYVVRVRLPAAARWGVHHHKNRLNATIVSGALLIGFGDRADATKMVRLTAGSFVSIPGGTNYYDATVGVTVVQEEGQGPMTTVMAKPS
jgi:uncharacterized RmlC-like cupin family protein